MRFLLTLTGCCWCLLALAQNTPQSLRIQLSYEKPGHHLEQAVETIEAVSIVGGTNIVDFEAGRSVTLLPGFQAKSGSIFSASIRPIIAKMNDFSLQLKAFPNPFDQSTTIDYYLPVDGKVNLWITDTQGKIVGQLLKDVNQSAGPHKIEWQPGSLNAGVYLPILEANQQKTVSRIVKK